MRRNLSVRDWQQAIVRDVLAEGGFWSSAESTLSEQFITEFGRHIPVIYEQANANGPKVQPVGADIAGAHRGAVLIGPEAAG